MSSHRPGARRKRKARQDREQSRVEAWARWRVQQDEANDQREAAAIERELARVAALPGWRRAGEGSG